MKISKNTLLGVVISASAVGFQDTANAEEESKERTASEIAAELSNPNTALGTMNFNLDYIAFDGDLAGADKQSAVRMTFQPSLPYPMDNGFNFFARPAIPIIFKQDVPTANEYDAGGLGHPGTFEEGVPSSTGYDNTGFNLGDIGFDVGVGKSFSNGLVAIDTRISNGTRSWISLYVRYPHSPPTVRPTPRINPKRKGINHIYGYSRIN